MDTLEIILAIISGVLGIGGAGLALWVKKIRNTLKEAAELFIAIDNALEDNTIGPDEAKRIAKEATDIYKVWKG